MNNVNVEILVDKTEILLHNTEILLYLIEKSTT